MKCSVRGLFGTSKCLVESRLLRGDTRKKRQCVLKQELVVRQASLVDDFLQADTGVIQLSMPQLVASKADQAPQFFIAVAGGVPDACGLREALCRAWHSEIGLREPKSLQSKRSFAVVARFRNCFLQPWNRLLIRTRPQ